MGMREMKERRDFRGMAVTSKTVWVLANRQYRWRGGRGGRGGTSGMAGDGLEAGKSR
jgi:hypothetical protein